MLRSVASEVGQALRIAAVKASQVHGMAVPHIPSIAMQGSPGMQHQGIQGSDSALRGSSAAGSESDAAPTRAMPPSATKAEVDWSDAAEDASAEAVAEAEALDQQFQGDRQRIRAALALARQELLGAARQLGFRTGAKRGAPG